MLSERELVLCELLVLRCVRRDPQAAAELANLFQRPLIFYLRRLVSSEDDAWDLAQETWLRVLRALPALREPRALPAVIFRTARNQAFALLRDRKVHEPFDETAHDVSGDEDPHDSVSLAEDAAAVHRALGRLSLPHREILTLHFLKELSMDDVAAVLDIPVGTVKSRLHYAKKALRSALGSETS